MMAPSGLEKFSDPINIAVLAEAVKGIFIFRTLDLIISIVSLHLASLSSVDA